MFTAGEIYSDAPPLKSQIQMGLDIDDMECRDERVLTLRPNDNLACVYESTAKKLQWDVLTLRIFQLASPYDNESYPVSYRIMGGSVNNVEITDKSSELDVEINSWDDGHLEILLPFGFIVDESSNDVVVLIDEIVVSYTKTLDESGSVILAFKFHQNGTDIRIISTRANDLTSVVYTDSVQLRENDY